MKQFLEKNKLWLAVEFVLLLIIAVLSIFCGGKDAPTWSLIITALAGAAVSYIPFHLGVLAHRNQGEQLKQIKDYLIEEKNEVIKNVSTTSEAIRPYVHIALYAMYQAYLNRPFEYRLIDPKNELVYKFIILAITSSFKTDSIIARIADEYLEVDLFDSDSIQLVTDGEALISLYSDSPDSGKMVRQCIERINMACGISQS